MNAHDSSLDGFLVRSATDADVDAIADFNLRLAHETENVLLDRDTVRQGVAKGFQQGEEVQYFVAEVSGQPIGTLMMTREWSDWRCGWFYWLQSVYVVSAHRAEGVFRGLLQHAENTLGQRDDVVGLRLYVEEENEAAQATYVRTGFTDAKYRVFEKKY